MYLVDIICVMTHSLSSSAQLGKTACHYAAERGHLDVLKYLYDYVERMVSPPVTNEVNTPP